MVVTENNVLIFSMHGPGKPDAGSSIAQRRAAFG
jgi:hypothetical protein